MQFGGYNEYSIGGIFGVLDSTGGSTSGDITFDFGNGTSAGDLIEKVRFTHEGNVGIGTTSPNALGFLEKVLNVSAGSSSSTTLSQAGITISGSSDSNDSNDFAYLSFTNHQSTLSADRVAEIRVKKVGTDVDTGEFTFYTANGTSLAEALTINSSQNATFAGNLTVQGADAITIPDYILHAGDDSKFGFPSNDNFKIRLAGSDLFTMSTTTATFAGDVTLEGGTAKTLLINASTHNASVQNTAKLQLGFAHSGSPQAYGHIVLQETANNSFDGTLIFSAPQNNGSGGSQTVDCLNIKGSDKSATFAGKVNVAGSTNNESSLNVLTQSGSIGSIGFETGSEVTGIISSNTELMEFRVGDGIGISSAKQLKIDTGGIEVTGDIDVTNSSDGLILKSPDGTRYRVTVANGGTLSVSTV
jgi:hypothetical protein